MFDRHSIAPVLICIGVSFAPCAVAASRSDADPGASQKIVQQASQFPEMVQKIDILVRLGWQHEGFENARLLPGEGGVASVVTAFERRGVGRDGAERRLTAELVYVADPQGPIVLLRPGDDRAAEVLKAQLGTDSDATLPDATCDAGCNYPNCVWWGCDYVSSQGFHWGCFALPSNPFGHYYVRTRRTGTTNPAMCVGWWADYAGNGVACPLPNTTFSWVICGFM